MEKRDRTSYKFWNKFLWPAYLLRQTLGFLADFWIAVGRLLGSIYTTLFAFVGTSWYDHRFDFLRGPGNYYWMERAFFALERISASSTVLDLGCGDGILSGLFYAPKAAHVLAIDKDPRAIKQAAKHYRLKNLRFICRDIRNYKFVKNKFDVILMFVVIEHFKPQDGLKILKKLRQSLKPNGILFGSTPIIGKTEFKANFEHENEFESAEILEKFLKHSFTQVKTFQTNWPNRNECYFECKKTL